MIFRSSRVVCTISILINIFLIVGVIAGVATLHAGRVRLRAGAMHIAGSELPKAEREAFHRTLRMARQDAWPLIRADRQARQETAVLLQSPDVDPHALAASLARLRTADMAVRAFIEDRASAFIVTLPAADRARVAENMERKGGASSP